MEELLSLQDSLKVFSILTIVRLVMAQNFSDIDDACKIFWQNQTNQDNGLK